MPRYDRTGTTCSSGPQTGTRALYAVVLEVFGGRPLGVYNCRPVRGGSRLSEHGEGRAIDIGYDAFDPADRERGDSLADALVEHAEALGIQSVVWNRRVWGYGRWYWRDLTGGTPHTDHVHAGQHWTAARTLTETAARAALEDDMYTDADRARDNELHRALVGHVQAGPHARPGDVHDLATPILSTNGKVDTIFQDRADLPQEVAAAVAERLPAGQAIDLDQLAEKVADELADRMRA